MLLKTFQLEGRFPARREDVPRAVVSHLAEQLGISAALYGQVPWEGRTVRRHRADILAFCGYRSFEEADEATLVAWLTPQVMDPNPEVESLKALTYSHIRSSLLEPPSSERLRRLLRRAVAQRDAEILASIASQLTVNTRASLDALDTALPSLDGVKIKTSKKGKGHIVLTPLPPQLEPPHIVKLTATLVQRWPMTNLLDILKEAELRVGFTEALRTVGTREVLEKGVLQRRLLLCLHGLGTNAGLKRMCSGGGEDSYADLQYIRRRYLHKDSLRAAIAGVCNAIFSTRQASLWGEGTTACASDSKKFGAWRRGVSSRWDQNLMTEWNAHYGGRGVMIYWHADRPDRTLLAKSSSGLKEPTQSGTATGRLGFSLSVPPTHQATEIECGGGQGVLQAGLL